jgi:hypothetical protein
MRTCCDPIRRDPSGGHRDPENASCPSASGIRRRHGIRRRIGDPCCRNPGCPGRRPSVGSCSSGFSSLRFGTDAYEGWSGDSGLGTNVLNFGNSFGKKQEKRRLFLFLVLNYHPNYICPCGIRSRDLLYGRRRRYH